MKRHRFPHLRYGIGEGFSSSSQASKLSPLVVAIIAVLILCGVAAGVWYYFHRASKSTSDTPLNPQTLADPLNVTDSKDRSAFKISLPDTTEKLMTQLTAKKPAMALFRSTATADMSNADALDLYQLLIANLPEFVKTKLMPCAEEGVNNKRKALNNTICFLKNLGNIFESCRRIRDVSWKRPQEEIEYQKPYPDWPQPLDFFSQDDCEKLIDAVDKNRDVIFMTSMFIIFMIEWNLNRASDLLIYTPPVYENVPNSTPRLVSEEIIIINSQNLIDLMKYIFAVQLKVAENNPTDMALVGFKRILGNLDIKVGQTFEPGVFSLFFKTLLRIQYPYNYNIKPCGCDSTPQLPFADQIKQQATPEIIYQIFKYKAPLAERPSPPEDPLNVPVELDRTFYQKSIIQVLNDPSAVTNPNVVQLFLKSATPSLTTRFLTLFKATSPSDFSDGDALDLYQFFIFNLRSGYKTKIMPCANDSPVTSRKALNNCLCFVSYFYEYFYRCFRILNEKGSGEFPTPYPDWPTPNTFLQLEDCSLIDYKVFLVLAVVIIIMIQSGATKSSDVLTYTVDTSFQVQSTQLLDILNYISVTILNLPPFSLREAIPQDKFFNLMVFVSMILYPENRNMQSCPCNTTIYPSLLEILKARTTPEKLQPMLTWFKESQLQMRL